MKQGALQKILFSGLMALTLSSPSAWARFGTRTLSPAELRQEASQLAVQVEEESRLTHARELIGKKYKQFVKTGRKALDSSAMSHFVRHWTERELKPKYRRQSRKVAKAILEESEKYAFDPVFLMAVIENESSFNPDAVGPIGEIGLMQLTPATADWISKKYHLPYRGQKSLRDPVSNVRLGAAYLAFLQQRFDFHSRLYLAAYNMGATNVDRALKENVWPKDYPVRVMNRYLRFYAKLKQDIKKTTVAN